MRRTHFPVLAAAVAVMVLADVAPGGCGRRPAPPVPNPDKPPPAEVPAPAVPAAPADAIPAPPAY